MSNRHSFEVQFLRLPLHAVDPGGLEYLFGVQTDIAGDAPGDYNAVDYGQGPHVVTLASGLSRDNPLVAVRTASNYLAVHPTRIDLPFLLAETQDIPLVRLEFLLQNPFGGIPETQTAVALARKNTLFRWEKGPDRGIAAHAGHRLAPCSEFHDRSGRGACVVKSLADAGTENLRILLREGTE